MGYDRKYGKITTEHGDIGENEPVVLFRAQDNLLPKVLAYYHLFCLASGSPRRHLDIIMNTRDAVIKWQRDNPSRVPNSESSRDRLES